MRPRAFLAIVLAALLLESGRAEFRTSRRLAAQQLEDPGLPRATAPLTILQLNDVYSTVPVDGMGGLARIATLKRQLADSGRNRS